jgi:hypothetical protein
MLTKNPDAKQASGSAPTASKKTLSKAAARKILKELKERGEQERLDQWQRPRIQTGIIEEVVKDEEIAKKCAELGGTMDAESIERRGRTDEFPE